MNGEQLIPFTYSSYKNTYASSFEFYGDYVFAGLCNSGMVIRSKNRYSWEKFYQTPDTSVSALKVYNGYMYIGTSPEGNIYRINLSDFSAENFGNMGSEIVNFVLFNSELYVAINGPATIMKLDAFTDQFNFVYAPYAKINDMAIISDKIYLALESSNMIIYDGTNWNKVIMNNQFTNVSSYRNISKEIYSHSNLSSIVRSSVIGSDNLSDEETLNIFPIHKSNGISRIVQDGSSVVIGSSNHTRIYRLMYENMDMIFNTEGTSVDDILNIDVGVNLMASKNKVYLVHSGKLDASSVETTTTTTTITTEENQENKAVVVTYPNGGEIIQLGDFVNIQWSSTKGINDAVKIELVKSNTITVISSQTSNGGIYIWEIPLSLTEGDDYKIRISWLSAGSSDPNNIDESNGAFSIVNTIAATTTTTTTLPDLQKLDTSSNRGIPILELPEFEFVTKMVNDEGTNSVLLATSNGRIIKCDILTVNAYLTGERLVYADVYDGCGYVGSAQTVFNYALYKKLVELDQDKQIQAWKYDSNIIAIKSETITAIFQGPIVNIRNDFGFWKELTWEEIKPDGADITIYLRAAASTEELMKHSWIYSASSENGEIGTITRSLNNVGLHGQYIQIKVEMKVNVKDIIPSVTNVTLKYSTKNSSYFFTNKFTIDLKDPAQKGLLTAIISKPINTEIQFGIASDNVTNWDEYQLITPDKMFDINNSEFRVGIKFTSYDASLPVVSEFAIVAGGEVLKGLNS